MRVESKRRAWEESVEAGGAGKSEQNGLHGRAERAVRPSFRSRELDSSTSVHQVLTCPEGVSMRLLEKMKHRRFAGVHKV